MATFTASAAQAGAQPYYNAIGTVSRIVQYNHSVAFSVGDVVQMVKVPKDAVVTDLAVQWSLSAGVITARIGDSVSISAFATEVAYSAGAAAVAPTDALKFAGFGRVMAADDKISIGVTALSAVPGTAKVKMRVSYTLQNGGD